MILKVFRAGKSFTGDKWGAGKVFLFNLFWVREKFFLFLSLLEGGGRHLFIFAAEIRVRAAFISSGVQIQEGGGSSGGGRAVLRNYYN